jgi:hypothetical protein
MSCARHQPSTESDQAGGGCQRASARSAALASGRRSLARGSTLQSAEPNNDPGDQSAVIAPEWLSRYTIPALRAEPIRVRVASLVARGCKNTALTSRPQLPRAGWRRNSDGQLITRVAWLASLDAVKFDSVTIDDVSVRLFGDTAVVRGRTAMVGGAPMNVRLRVTRCLSSAMAAGSPLRHTRVRSRSDRCCRRFETSSESHGRMLRCRCVSLWPCSLEQLMPQSQTQTGYERRYDPVTA